MLYLVATPIGNLGDITYRAAETLRNADEIWCEDTRHTAILLQHLGIRKPLVSCHEHTEKSRAALLTEKLGAGLDIAYVSDAGMPGISDPGAILVSACIEAGLSYTVLPGACAFVTAAVLSGLDTGTLCFFGFLPRTGRERRERLAKIAACAGTAIIYESPHRVHDTLGELARLIGDVPACLCRELTKLHETAHRGTLLSLFEETADAEVRGECVLLVAVPEQSRAADAEDPDTLLLRLLKDMSTRDAAAEAARLTGLNKKQLYARALALKNGTDAEA